MFTKQEAFSQPREMGVPQNRPVTIHACTSPDGCYGRLAEEDGYVLLAGCCS